MNIFYTKAAEKDLASLLEFISDESPRNALLVINRLEKHIKLLTTQPEMGRPGRLAETRELVVPKTPFVIPYQVKGKKLIILRVYHESQKWPDKTDY